MGNKAIILLAQAVFGVAVVSKSALGGRSPKSKTTLVSATECPGTALWKEIHTWVNWSA